MCLDDVISVVPAVPDSHYRLKRCRCGSDHTAYIQRSDERWAVRCFDCGQEGLAEDTRHGAQQTWNLGAVRVEEMHGA